MQGAGGGGGGEGGGWGEERERCERRCPLGSHVLSMVGGGCFSPFVLTRVSLVTSVYVHVLLGVRVWDEVQRGAGESVELFQTLSSDVFVDFLKAVTANVTPQEESEHDAAGGEYILLLQHKMAE